MPLTHVRAFRVRQYECDAYGHVNHAVYLRYMQEAAFDASAAAGYDMDRYRTMDYSWLIRETEIEYRRPLRYDDRVEVKTWVHDFRRVRSQRAYEFRLAGKGDPSDDNGLVARAMTDWVYLQTSTGRPAIIPEEMKVAFMPEGVPASLPPRERFPTPPPPPPGEFRQQRRVEWRDLDAAGHVNNSVYLNYIEDCGLQMMRAFGWPLERMSAEGLAVVARGHHIEYRIPVLLDDELELATWLSDVGRSTAVRHTTISRPADGALLARTRTLHVWVDLNTGTATAIPENLRADLALIVA
jgi:acyl-CoA thioester hydrolase